MMPSLAASSRIPVLNWKGEARRATVLQHHHNILHCHNITARWKVKSVCVFPEGIFRVQRVRGKDQKEERGCSVSDPPECGLSVEGDELCLCTAGHRLWDLLLLLLLLLWRPTRGSHLEHSRNKK